MLQSLQIRYVVLSVWCTVKLYTHLDKVQHPSETPGHRVEPFWPRVRPSRINQLSQVTVGEVAVATAAWWVVFLGDVAGGEMANAQEVTGPFDVTFFLGSKGRQSGRPQSLLRTFPSYRNTQHVMILFLTGARPQQQTQNNNAPMKSFITWG